MLTRAYVRGVHRIQEIFCYGRNAFGSRGFLEREIGKRRAIVRNVRAR